MPRPDRVRRRPDRPDLLAYQRIRPPCKALLANARTVTVVPSRPRTFTGADAGAGAGSTRHLTFEWALQSDAAAYDVLQNTRWLGRVHCHVFFAESVYVTVGRTFNLVPIGTNGNRGPVAVARL